MESSLVRGVLPFAVLIGLCVSARAQIPFKIPLYIFDVSSGTSTKKEYKVGIRLKVGSVSNGRETPWRMYEFDTGGTGFLAFPYATTQSGNIAGAYTVDYGSGNHLTGNDSATTVTFEGQGPLPNPNVRTNLVLITGASSDKQDDALNAWRTALPNTPPLETYFYGDFGMALDRLQASESGKPALYAIIPQLAGKHSAGFIIHLGERPSDGASPGRFGEIARGWIQVGLTAKQRRPSSWDSSVAMAAPTGDVYPRSGLPVYAEILSSGTFHLTGLDSKASGIVYDTGAPNVEIHPVGSDQNLETPITDILDSGDTVTLKLEGNPANWPQSSTILDFQVADESGVNKADVSTKNVIHSPGLYVNTGITAFFGNDVAFNLKDGFVGFRKTSARTDSE